MALDEAYEGKRFFCSQIKAQIGGIEVEGFVELSWVSIKSLPSFMKLFQYYNKLFYASSATLGWELGMAMWYNSYSGN